MRRRAGGARRALNPSGSGAATRALGEIAARVRRCRACGLHRSRRSAVPGEGSGRSGVVLIGEAPGAREDALGRPFVGSAGRLLGELLRRAGIPRSEVFITNVVKCRPPGNRPPKRAEVEACAPYLAAQLELIRPALVCTLGNSALRALVDPGGSVSEMRGREVRRGGVSYFPLYHPAAILYRRKLIKEMERDLAQVRRAALRVGGLGRGPLEPEEE